MKYIVLPKSVLDEVPQETLNELHLVPRVSTDGESVLMKVANYELLFPLAVTLPELGEDAPVEPTYPYPTYEGEELDTLLQSSKWTSQDNSVLGESILESPTVKTTSSKTRKSTKNTVL
jgi:hypothetical protein